MTRQPDRQPGVLMSGVIPKSYLCNTHARQRRNALWFHATTKGLFDPVLSRIRPYTVDELATLWAVTPATVRRGIAEAEKINAKLTEITA